jgi:hypothetical protein
VWSGRDEAHRFALRRDREGLMPKIFSDPDILAEEIIRDVGTTLVVGLPLGLGKANHVINALFKRALADRSISLTIFTALTLEKPKPGNELERRFISPVIERLFGGYPELAYARALHDGTLPPNIQVNEFFFLAGQWLHNAQAQQHYISANYTHAASYLLARGLNVITQLVSKKIVDGVPRYSLSCNTDTTLDVLKARRDGRAAFKLIAQVNSELPFMPGDGDLGVEEFHAVLESPSTDFPLFAPPSEPITDTKYAIGLHCAGLIRDGGSLQIGIGQVGDALAQSLIIRHRAPDVFRGLMRRLGPHLPPPLETDVFMHGLYGISEMFFEAFLALIEADVIKRDVDGARLHAAFFLGPKSFYRALREMAPESLARIRMSAVSFTNELYGDEAAKRHARRDARFVNNAMMATLLGSVVSDGLDNGHVVSGVGGQYNFVAQAFALADARSILTLEATRGRGNKATSNILWSYGHETIPRHLRDIVVTEYGVADLRGKSDAEVIAAMLSIADSRFQPELMDRAKQAGKLPARFEIPDGYRNNVPDRIAAALQPSRKSGELPMFPFGTDFTDIEQRLIPALQILKNATASPWSLVDLGYRGMTSRRSTQSDQACLARLGLAQPKTFADRMLRLLVSGALQRTAAQS